MKNVSRRLLTLLLVLIMCISLAACGEKDPAGSENNGENETPDDKTYLYNLSDYSIVYSNQISNRAADAVTSLASRISDGTEVEMIPLIDRITDVGEKEILVGPTNRPESEEALALATNDETFVIKTFDNCIVINSKNDSVLIAAMEYFKELVTKQGFGLDQLEYVSDPVASVNITENKTSQFSIVHLDGLDTDLTDANEKYDLEVKVGYDVQSAIKSKTSAIIPVKSEAAAGEYQIIIGMASDPLCEEFRNSLAFDEYGYKVYGNKIIIGATNSTTLRKAAELFTESIGAFTNDAGTFTLYDGMCITRRSGTWNTEILEFEGGTFGGTLDSGNKSITVVYKDTTAEAFEAYCKKLEEAGYTLWQRHDIEDNLHATYTHETLGMVHTYFTGNESNVRIISYRKGTYNLPTHKENEKLDVVTRMSVTQYGLDRAGGSVGMCYVITLEDGSFIVVDSGTQNKNDTSHEEFYKLLQDLNKRPDGKIVIRAWYLTHEHSDHYNMFASFLKTYGKQITIDEFWCNPSTYAYTYNGANGNITWEKSHSKYRGYVNGDFKWITFHTGMEFYAGDLKFEPLYTEEDLFPEICRSYNNACTIMKMTDTKSGQTMIFMGDLLYDSCEILAKKYDKYLDCDLLQVAHHGKSEAQSVYAKMNPKVAFWSCTTAQMNSQTASKTYKEANTILRDKVPTHVTSSSTYTVYLPYNEGDKIYEWDK